MRGCAYGSRTCGHFTPRGWPKQWGCAYGSRTCASFLPAARAHVAGSVPNPGPLTGNRGRCASREPKSGRKPGEVRARCRETRAGARAPRPVSCQQGEKTDETRGRCATRWPEPVGCAFVPRTCGRFASRRWHESGIRARAAASCRHESGIRARVGLSRAARIDEAYIRSSPKGRPSKSMSPKTPSISPSRNARA
jgi:hypothetical protein